MVDSMAPRLRRVRRGNAGLGNPEHKGTPFVGPVPQGLWDIGDPVDTPNLRFALPLTPVDPETALGRDELFIHGDNSCQCTPLRPGASCWVSISGLRSPGMTTVD